MNLADNNMEITIIMPAYNKESTIIETIQRAMEVMNSALFIIVDDGSLDNTWSILERIFSENNRIKLVRNLVNSGKGSAIRTGAENISTEFFAYLDCDLDIHPSGVATGIHELRINPQIVCAYGSKLHKLSTVSYPAHRKIFSYLFRALIFAIFRIGVSDTQTGLKVFRSKEVLDILLATKSNGWLMDLELFIQFKRRSFSIIEIPVELYYDFTSTIKISDIASIAFELVKFKILIALKKY
jgi:dolichol-phosphate mannosyltransferase